MVETWLTLSSAPETGHAAAVELDARAGAADGAALAVADADQAALGEVGDQRGHRGAGHAELGGQRGARARAVVAQPAQDEAEVGPAHGDLVGVEGAVGSVDRPHLRHLPPDARVTVVTTLSGRCTN